MRGGGGQGGSMRWGDAPFRGGGGVRFRAKRCSRGRDGDFSGGGGRRRRVGVACRRGGKGRGEGSRRGNCSFERGVREIRAFALTVEHADGSDRSGRWQPGVGAWPRRAWRRGCKGRRAGRLDGLGARGGGGASSTGSLVCSGGTG
jgi:hypothetical protein